MTRRATAEAGKHILEELGAFKGKERGAFYGTTYISGLPHSAVAKYIALLLHAALRNQLEPV